MNINIVPLNHYVASLFQQNSQSFLSVKSQKTTIIVSIALVCLAALCVAYRCFKKRGLGLPSVKKSGWGAGMEIGELKGLKKEISHQSISQPVLPNIDSELVGTSTKQKLDSAIFSSLYFDTTQPFETKIIDEIIYQGQFKDGQLHGMGMVICGNRILEGQFEDGFLNGLGKVTFNNGKILEGTFAFEQLIKGKIVYPGIRTEEGIFHNDLLNDEKGKITYADGRIEEGRFIMGKKIKSLQDWIECMGIA